MAGIVPPFGFKFRMREVVLGKREGSSGKRAFEFLAQKCRSKGSKGQENHKAGGHCEPKANQSHPPRLTVSDYTDYVKITPIRVAPKIRRNLWNLFLEICVIKRAKNGFLELSPNFLLL